MDEVRFTCACCGQEHVGIPELTMAEPLPWAETPVEGRPARGELGREICRLDEESFFVRAVLELPIVGRDRSLGYGVWVSLSPPNFARFQELDGSDRGEGDGPWFGWLSVRLPGYPDTFALKTRVHLRPSPMRPRIELEPTSHPLAMEQRLGIRLARAIELAELGMHPERSPDELTQYVHVQCGAHGEGHGCFVCRHIARGEGTGWFSGPRFGDPRPDAWCDACEAAHRAAGGWTEESEATAGITLICHHCYEERQARREL